MRGGVPQPRCRDTPYPGWAWGGWARRGWARQWWDNRGGRRGWRATPGGVRPRQARCQASLCSRRRAGGGPGAPCGPAAADANLCPPAQQAAGGLGEPAGVVGGWRGHFRAAPAHLASPLLLVHQGPGLQLPSLRGQAVMACGGTPHDVTTMSLLSPIPPAALSVP